MKYKVIKLCDNMYKLCSECETPCFSRLDIMADEYDMLILDIGEIKSMNSTLISSVLSYRDKIVLCNPTPISLNIFTILGVDKFVKIFENIDKAVAYVNEGSGIYETVSHRK